jgi:hypothetical protein
MKYAVARKPAARIAGETPALHAYCGASRRKMAENAKGGVRRAVHAVLRP